MHEKIKEKQTIIFDFIMAVTNPFFSAFFVYQEDLITRILKDFLNINDVCNLDSSVCNHEHRDNYLKCSKGSCFDGSMSAPLGDTFLNWARRRHVSVTRLSWRLDSQLSFSILRDLCKNYSWNLTFLKVSSSQTCISLTYFLDIITNCEGLEELDLEDFEFIRCITDSSFEFILRTCTNLKYINVMNCERITLLAVESAEARLPDLNIIHSASDSFSDNDSEGEMCENYSDNDSDREMCDCSACLRDPEENHHSVRVRDNDSDE
jgi:hypothetical protein